MSDEIIHMVINNFFEIQSNISNDFEGLEVINILGELLTPPDPLLFYY